MLLAVANVIRLRTLGGLELQAGAGHLLPRRRKELALIAYLARQDGRAVSRATLADLLWEDRDEARARQSLRQAVADIRHAAPGALRVTPESVQLVSDAVRLDVQDFEEALAAGRFAEAVALWQGGFLANGDDIGGEAFRAWLVAEREALLRRLARAQEVLVEQDQQAGNWKQAVTHARHWCDALPLDERGHTRLIHALRLAGRRAEAADLHSEFTRRVRHELGAEPGPDFLALAGGDPDATGDAAVGGAGLFTPDLVGREDAFRALTEAWRSVKMGGGSVLVVEGDEGAGKTRLLHEFCRSVRSGSSRAVVLEGRGHETERATEFSTARHLFDALSDVVPLAAAAPEALATLSLLLPRLRDRFRHLPAAPPGADAAGATSAALAAVASEAPVLLVLDDATFADGASARVLAELVRRPVRGVMLVLTATGGLTGSDLESDVERNSSVRWIRLSPLDRLQVAQMVQSMASMAPDQLRSLAERLHRASGGNPDLVRSTLTLLADAGLLVLQGDGHWEQAPEFPKGELPVPVDVRHRTRAALSRSSAQAQRVLEAAAVLGGVQPCAVLERVSGLGTDEFTDALGQALTLRLLQQSVRDASAYGFRSEAARRAVHDGIAPSRARALHRMAAASLSGLAGQDQARQLAVREHRALGREFPGARVRRWSVAAAALAAAAVAVLAFWPRRPAATSLGGVAVFPFETNGSDSIAYLAFGMPDLLGIGLDGAGSFTRLDSRLVIDAAQSAGAGLLTPVRAREVARRIGASHFVLGRVIEGRATIALEATLYNAIERDASPVGAAVRGRPDAVFSLVDSLTLQLIAGASRGDADRLADLAARTTASLPALKLYLAGVDQLRERRIYDAIEAFQGAVALDSGFALAWHRMSGAAEWVLDGPLARHAADRAVATGEHLPARARTFLRAQQSMVHGSYQDAIAAYGELITQTPNDTEAQLGQAEALFHSAWRRGVSFRTTGPAFRGVLALDSTAWAAQQHHVHVLSRSGQRAAAAAQLDRYVRLNHDSAARQFLRQLGRLHLGSPASRDSVLAQLPTLRNSFLVEFVWQSTMLTGDPDQVAPFAQAMTHPLRPDRAPVLGHTILAYLAVARARFDEANAHLDTASVTEPVTALLHRVGLALSAPGAADEHALRMLRQQLEATEPLAPQEAGGLPAAAINDGAEPQLRAYLLARLDCLLNECRGVPAVAEQLASHRFPRRVRALDINLARSLRAHVALHAGDTSSAVVLLWTSWDSVDFNTGRQSPFYSRPDDRRLLALLLGARGDTTTAAGLRAGLAEHSPFDLAVRRGSAP